MSTLLILSGHLVVTQEVHAIIRQPDISVPELPSLPEHQQHARIEGQYWLKTVAPACNETTLDIVNYAKNFQATYKELLTLAESFPKDLNSQINTHLKKLWDDPSAKRDAADHVGLLVKDLIVKFQIILRWLCKRL